MPATPFSIEAGAGVGSGFADEAYKAAGAQLVPVDEVWAKADMIYKVKEPLPSEYGKFKPGQILYTYLHLAAAYARECTDAMIKADIRAIAFETVETPEGGHPLLFPMSEVAGKLAIQAGATHLQKNNGGEGVLLGGVTGVPPAKVVIIGGGTVGTNAAKCAVGAGARTVVLDTSAPRLTYLDDVFGGRIETVLSNEAIIEEEIADADLVIGGVLLPHGAQAPHLVKQGHAQAHEAGLGPGRRRHRPGRLLRDLQAHLAQRADLCGRRRDSLLRRQHAGRSGSHVHPRARRRNAAVRAADRHQGLRAGRQGQPGSRPRRQRLSQQAHDPVGCRGAQAAVHAPRHRSGRGEGSGLTILAP